jgi:hypothetical protein
MPPSSTPVPQKAPLLSKRPLQPIKKSPGIIVKTTSATGAVTSYYHDEPAVIRENLTFCQEPPKYQPPMEFNSLDAPQPFLNPSLLSE